MLHYGVYWIRLLQFKQKLFHCLNSVVPTQVYGNFFNLKKKSIYLPQHKMSLNKYV